MGLKKLETRDAVETLTVQRRNYFNRLKNRRRQNQTRAEIADGLLEIDMLTLDGTPEHEDD